MLTALVPFVEAAFFGLECGLLSWCGWTSFGSCFSCCFSSSSTVSGGQRLYRCPPHSGYDGGLVGNQKPLPAPLPDDMISIQSLERAYTNPGTSTGTCRQPRCLLLRPRFLGWNAVCRLGAGGFFGGHAFHVFFPQVQQCRVGNGFIVAHHIRVMMGV